jgi:ParB family chromosome partitioning protein
MEVLELPTGQVHVSNRLRAVNTDKVKQIAFSMLEKINGKPRGQMAPIEVVPAGENGRYRLIFGAHRYSAVVEAGIPTVRAVLYTGSIDPDELLLREIDENLYRNDLSPYDFATFIAERARLFEKLNGKIKQGVKKKGQLGTFGFTEETAKALGFSERTVKRARERMKKILPDVWSRLRGTEVAENGSFLDALAALTAEQQRKVADQLQGASSFQYALNLVVGRPSGKPKGVTAEFNALVSLWDRTSPEAQERFRKHIRKVRERLPTVTEIIDAADEA